MLLRTTSNSSTGSRVTPSSFGRLENKLNVRLQLFGEAGTTSAPSDEERDELVHVRLTEYALALVEKVAVVVDGIRLERDIRLAAHHGHAQNAQDLPQVLLADRRADDA